MSAHSPLVTYVLISPWASLDFNFKSNWKWRESDSDLHQMRRENAFYWIKWTSMFEKRQFRQFSRNCQYLHLRLLIFLIIVEDDRSSLQDKLCFYKTEETNFCLDLSSLTATWHLVHATWHRCTVWQHSDSRETLQLGLFWGPSTFLIYFNPGNIFFFLNFE